MMKNIYKRGARKEYHLISLLKKDGYDIAQRTAGSHSPIDIIAFHKEKRLIRLIQSKRIMDKRMSDIDLKLKEDIEKDYSWLNGEWLTIFEVL